LDNRPLGTTFQLIYNEWKDGEVKH
jgi:hypothetical protein